jgi:hypothetical protein
VSVSPLRIDVVDVGSSGSWRPGTVTVRSNVACAARVGQRLLSEAALDERGRAHAQCDGSRDEEDRAPGQSRRTPPRQRMPPS